jgi:hypothetical protein
MRLLSFSPGNQLRQPKIECRPAPDHYDVSGFQVAVKDVIPMGLIERTRNLDR